MARIAPDKVLRGRSVLITRGLPPWDQSFSATTRLLRRHRAGDNWRRQRQPRDAVEDRSEQVPRDGHLGQLERHVLRVPRHLRANLDQLLPQRREGPVSDRFGQGQPPQEMAQVVGQGEQLQTGLETSSAPRMDPEEALSRHLQPAHPRVVALSMHQFVGQHGLQFHVIELSEQCFRQDNSRLEHAKQKGTDHRFRGVLMSTSRGQ